MPELDATTHPLFELVNSGLAVTAAACIVLAFVAGTVFVRNMWVA